MNKEPGISNAHTAHLNTMPSYSGAKRPLEVLEDFFDFASVPEAKECLGEWLLASLRANDGEELNYMHLWQHLERLIEACWLMRNEAR